MKTKLIYILLLISALFSCGKNEDDIEVIVDNTDNYRYEILRKYNFGELQAMEKLIGLPIGFITFVGTKPKYEGDTQVKIYKVMFQSENPNGNKQEITLSGLLIVPPLENGKSYRQVVAPPYTFISRDAAPTVRIEQDKLEEHLIFWIIEAYRYGYAVMIPDYPGFGDSYGECFIPYVEKSPMVRTTIEYVSVSRQILEKENYKQKEGLLISGYSLGAYISLQVAREIEIKNLYKIDYLMVGGSPCNLLQEAELIRQSTILTQPYLFPLALLGFKKNGYQHLVMTDYLNEPYASEAALRLDGQHEFENYFPTRTSELFTDAFINNRGMDEVNRLLEENSVKPWQNKCKFQMTHGGDEVTVYYAQARDFSAAQNEVGGKVEFEKTSGSHTSAGILFYLKLLVELEKIR
jgi:pimeloyl-ACP methyl ester carboxylesterase